MDAATCSYLPSSIKLTGGHTQALLCCHSPTSCTSTVATSSQDGTICLFDLRSKNRVHKFDFFGCEAVTSILFAPESIDILYAAAGTSIYCIDIRLGSSGREVKKYNFNKEEINQVAVTRKGNYLAAADDSGEVKVIDLQSQKLLKTLRGVHTNICSSVQFHPYRPWELMTGGLDARIVKWDFSKGRPLKVINQGAFASSEKKLGQYCNPPFVHVLVTSEMKLCKESEKLMAVAKGDGTVEVCDLELENWQELQPEGKKYTKHLEQNKMHKGQELQPAIAATSDDKIPGHAAAVSAITFARFAQTGSLIISGSNDRSIKLWGLDKTSSNVSQSGGLMIMSINHKRKVNWMSTATSSSENLFVADTSKALTVYSII